MMKGIHLQILFRQGLSNSKQQEGAIEITMADNTNSSVKLRKLKNELWQFSTSFDLLAVAPQFIFSFYAAFNIYTSAHPLYDQNSRLFVKYPNHNVLWVGMV